MSNGTKFSPELRERAVRMVQEGRSHYPSLWKAVTAIAPKIGCTPTTLLSWVKRAEIDRGQRPGVSTEEREHIKVLEREVKELRRANEILKLASAFFCPGGAGPQTEVNAFIDMHRAVFGVEPICRVLQVAPSAYWRHAARQRNPALRSNRAKRDAVLMPQIQRVFEENWQVYGARKIWLELHRQGIQVARCTVARLMRRMGLQGVRRGIRMRTTVSDAKLPCPLDLVDRNFHASRPNQLWVVDFSAP